MAKFLGQTYQKSETESYLATLKHLCKRLLSVLVGKECSE